MVRWDNCRVGKRHNASLSRARWLSSRKCCCSMNRRPASISVTQHSVLDLIKRLHQDLGLTIVLITHDINMIRLHVDRLVLLKTRLYAAGPPADVLKPDILSQVYGKDLVITDKDVVIVEDYHHH